MKIGPTVVPSIPGASKRPSLAEVDSAPATELFTRSSEDLSDLPQVELLRLKKGGNFEKIVKIPIDKAGRHQQMEGPDGRIRHLVQSPDRRSMLCLDENGEIDFRFESARPIQAVYPQPGKDRICVRGSESFHFLDREGSEVARIVPKDFNCLAGVCYQPSGEVALSVETGFQKSRVTQLTPELTEKWSTEVDFEVDELIAVGNNHVAALDDGDSLAVLGKNGEVLLKTENLALYSTTYAEGKLWFVEHTPSRYDQKGTNIVCFDPQTEEVKKFKGDSDVDWVKPLPNGGFLTGEGPAGHPHVTLWGDDGSKVCKRLGDEEAYFRELQMSQDGRHALIRLGDGENKIYHLDLAEQPTRGALFGLKQNRQTLQPIYRAEEKMVASMTGDGRVVVVGQSGVRTMTVEGKPLQNYHDASELIRKEPGLEIVTSAYSQESNYPNCAPGVDGWLRRVSELLGTPNPVLQSQPEGLFVSSDSCLNLVLPGVVPSLPAAIHESLAASSLLVGAGGGTSKVQNFLDNPRYKVHLEAGRVEAKGPDGQSLGSAWSEGGERFLCALPVTVGERRYLAAGSDHGRLHWVEVHEDHRQQKKLVFDVGAPIEKLVAGDQDELIALTTQGQYLLLHPNKKEGEVVHARSAESKELNLDIDMQEDSLDIGDFTVTRW